MAAWYLDRVIIRDRRFGLTGEWDYFFFPLHDWVVPAAQYVLQDCETFLPQQDPYPDLRQVQLDRRQQLLCFMQRASGLPVEVRCYLRYFTLLKIQLKQFSVCRAGKCELIRDAIEAP